MGIVFFKISECHKYILLIFFLIINLFSAFAQEPPSGNFNKPEIVPPSPTAQIFEEYGNVPVSLYTGIPDIKIPLWTVKVGKLELPIYLSYNASGVRVDELPGLVGMKWCLNYGGMISRNVNGRSDEDGNGWLKVQKFTDDPDPSITSQKDLLRDIARGCKDGQPDEFNISSPTVNCKFVFDENNNPTTIPFKKVKIINNNLNLDNWTVYDEKGNSYYFSTYETNSKISQSDYSGSNQSICTPDGAYKTGWMLDAMYSPNAYDEILFEYDNSFTVIVSNKLVSETFLFKTITEDYTYSGANYTPPYFINHTYESYTYNIKVPKKIKTRNQTIEFLYSSYANSDWGAKIDRINIYDASNNLIKSFKLDYTSISADNRPALYKVTEIGSDGTLKPAYEFTYSAVNLPINSSLSTDYYGYYNGKAGNSLISNNSNFYALYHEPSQVATDKNVDPNYNQAGILKKIKYPTGGFTEFTYETNKVIAPASEQISTTNPSYSFIDMDATGWHEETLIIGQGVIDVSLLSVNLSNYTGSNTLKPYFQLADANHTVLTQWTTSSTESQHLIGITPGTYYVRFHLDDLRDFGVIRFKLSSSSTVPEHEDYSGGLRVAGIKDYTETGSVAKEKLYQYNQFGTNVTSGKQNFSNMKFEYVYSMCRLSEARNKWDFYNYPAVTSVSRSNISMTRGSYVGYTDVTEINNSANYQNKSLHKFSYFPDWWGGAIILYTPNTSRDYKRGDELWSEDYDKDNKIVRRTENTYLYNGENTSLIKNCKAVYGLRVIEHGPSNCSLNSPYTYNWEAYYNISEWYYKSASKETLYNRNGTQTVKTVSYSFDNPEHAQLTSITEVGSDGKTLTSDYYYPSDNPSNIQTSATTISSMITNNMQVPLKIEKSVNQAVTEGIITNYGSNLLPENVYQLHDQTYEPVFYYDQYDNNGNILQFHSPNDINTSFIWGVNNSMPVAKIANAKNTKYSNQCNTTFLSAQYNSGSANSGTIGIVNVCADNPTVTISIAPNGYTRSGTGDYFYIYFNGSNRVSFTISDLTSKTLTLTPGQYTVTYAKAQITFFDADITCGPVRSNEVLYQGFEEYSGAKLSSTAKAGKYVLNNSFAINLADKIIGNYYLTYWSSTDGINWTFNKQSVNVTSGSTSQTIGSVSSYIDEVRFYPVGAQMTTYTYTPLVGMTSQTDANGVTSYYIYDSFGRLTDVKDGNGKVLKHYEYNYKQ